MTQTIDDLMQTASQALADLDYARCEALSLDGFDQARADEDWVMVRRVLLPLQEARRQKRQAAIDGLILLGTPEQAGKLQELIADERVGCVVLTRPYTADDAEQLDKAIRGSHRAIELLFADSAPDDSTWRITALHDADAWVDQPAPDRAWVGRWIDPLSITPPTPAHWFMRASEALGDAALARVDTPSGSIRRFDQIAHALKSVGDHEILHQRLADAAKALQEAKR